MKDFQHRCWTWFLQCFPTQEYRKTKERCFRFLEESIELVQSFGVTKEECLKLIDYVYGRPIGVPQQEVGGVMVTLAALTMNEGIDLENCANIELRRVNTPEMIEKIRSKQVSKRLAMTEAVK